MADEPIVTEPVVTEPVTPIGTEPVTPNPEAWRELVPEALRNEPSFANIKDIPDWANQFNNLQKLVGQDHMATPKETWEPEQWAEFYDATGRPKTAAEYRALADTDRDALGLTEDTLKATQEAFHKAGLSQSQMDGVLGHYQETISAQIKDHTDRTEQVRITAENDLKAEFGDKYDSTVDIANSVVKEFGDKDFEAYLETTGLGNNPAMVKMLAKLGSTMLEDKADGPGQNLNISEQTRAKQSIAALRLEQPFMDKWTNKNAVGHKEAVAKMDSLREVAFAEN